MATLQIVVFPEHLLNWSTIKLSLVVITAKGFIMRTITKTVYKFSELDDQAKDKARDALRYTSEYEADAVIEDFEQISKLIGLEINPRRVKPMNGETRYDPNVYYAVSHCQSDFASFSGQWIYKKGSKAAIRAYAPQDNELHAIVDAWNDLQRRNFYRLTATCSHGRDCQKVGDCTVDGRYTKDETLDAASDIVRDLANWLYKRLREEFEYQSSDEYIDEIIEANDYEFYENGEML